MSLCSQASSGFRQALPEHPVQVASRPARPASRCFPFHFPFLGYTYLHPQFSYSRSFTRLSPLAGTRAPGHPGLHLSSVLSSQHRAWSKRVEVDQKKNTLLVSRNPAEVTQEQGDNREDCLQLFCRTSAYGQSPLPASSLFPLSLSSGVSFRGPSPSSTISNQSKARQTHTCMQNFPH